MLTYGDTYIHTHIHSYIHTRIHAYIHECTHINTHTHIYQVGDIIHKIDGRECPKSMSHVQSLLLVFPPPLPRARAFRSRLNVLLICCDRGPAAHK
jgi:hypothetical protein